MTSLLLTLALTCVSANAYGEAANGVTGTVTDEQGSAIAQGSAPA